MRLWLVIGGLIAAAALVVVLSHLGGDDPHTPRPGSPETLAAAVALVYARGVRVGDEGVACGVMTLEAANAAGCGTGHAHLRSCGDFSIEETQILRFNAAQAEVELGSCRIELVPGTRTHWAVSKVEPA